MGKAATPGIEAKGYGAVSVPEDEVASRASYAEYHKVCDMRSVFDASAVGLAAILLTFFLVFTSWCAWHEVIEWVGVKYSYQGQTLVEFAATVNAVATFVLASLLVLMRYTVGPILSLRLRAVFACLLIMTAITIWEALEAVIDMLIGSESSDRAMFYAVALGGAIAAIGIFEVIFHYDVIGNHLLTPP